MGIIIGMVITLGCVFGGYMAMGGHIDVLIQPFEFVIIGGAAIGIFIIANPMSTVKDSGKAMMEALKNKVPSREEYLELLGLLHQLLRELKTKPRNEVESHIDNSEESSIFQEYPLILANKDLTNFICDYCRLIIVGNARPHEVEDLMQDAFVALFSRYDHEAPSAQVRLLRTIARNELLQLRRAQPHRPRDGLGALPQVVTEGPHHGPGRKPILQVAVDQQAGADIRRLVDVHLETFPLRNIPGEMVIEVRHAGTGVEDAHQGITVLVQRDVEHRHLVPGRDIEPLEERDVALDARHESRFPRLCEMQLGQRADAVGIPIEDVDEGHAQPSVER